MTDQNRTAETDEARDLVDTFQLEWDASYPGMHFKCVPVRNTDGANGRIHCTRCRRNACRV